MLIKDLFQKPVDRSIEGVIKADDTSHLRMEVEEYVITNEISAKLSEFFEAYNDSKTNTGVWISGFFGSGKSHLLKILSLVLENKDIDGLNVGEIFQEKAKEVDAFLAGEIARALRQETKSILFNIDQKADVITKKQNDAILAVFVKVFNELRGYYPKQPYIAAFEHELDQQGLLETFKQTILEDTGKEWETLRKTALLLKSDKFAQVYAKVTGNSAEQGRTILDHYRDTYSMSIEDFAEEVHEYIESQGPNFRLNFFVDEVGQFIADNSKLMVNLQTIVETLSTKCKGRAWVLVTSQEDLSNIVGEMAKVHNASDFSKIQDRFSSRLKLTSQDVAEVIQKRLLAKLAGSATDQLHNLFDQEHDNFKTLFDFGDGSRRYKVFEDAAAFAQSYPFPRYQYDLFQEAINQLSQHNAFTGKHSSVGERSMLGVFQQVSKNILNEDVGKLATFDLMFEGIRNVVKTEHQKAVLAAEKQIGDPFRVSVLKALFLVKYLKEFKSTARNIAILVTDSFSINLADHQKRVQEALNLLEAETYIQRNGEDYNFLTNDEKDIEEEIKNIEIQSSQVTDCAAKIIFETIIAHKKFDHLTSGNTYNFTRFTDGYRLGHEHELGIHVITPLNEAHSKQTQLVNKSMGTQEMFAVLPDDSRLYADIRALEQTEKYIKQFNTSGATTTKRLLLQDKADKNRKRKEDLTARVKAALGQAQIIVNGSTIEIGSSDAQTRLVEGFQALVSSVYSQLQMLRTRYSVHSMAQVFNTEGDDLFREGEGSSSEAENEIFTFLKSRKKEGSKTPVKVLLETFKARPYGWGEPAILTNLAKLFRRGKVELLSNATMLEGSAAQAHLSNTSKHADTIIQLQRTFDDSKVKALKTLHHELFNKRNEEADPKDAALKFIAELTTYVTTLRLCLARKTEFHFVDRLQPAIDSMGEWLEKDYTAYLTDIEHVADDWLDQKEDELDPITTFVQGNNGKTYSAAKSFYKDNRDNLAQIEEEHVKQLEDLLSESSPYRGKHTVNLRKTLDSCTLKLEQEIESKKAYARKELESYNQRFKTMDGFDALSQQAVDSIFQVANDSLKKIGQTNSLAVIDSEINVAATQGYQKQLNRFNAALEELTAKPATSSVTAPAKSAKGSSSTCVIKDALDPPATTTAYAKQVQARAISIADRPHALTSEDELDAYLGKLKAAYLEKLNDGFHIQL